MIIAHHFSCGKKNCKNIKMSQNILKIVAYKIFVLLFVFSLTVPVVKNSHILTRIYFVFLKIRPKTNFKLFFQILSLLNLGQNCVNDLSVTKIIKEIKFRGVWGELKAKYFPRDNRSKTFCKY